MTAQLSARLGGAFISDESDSPKFREQYDGIGYVFVDLPSGETMQFFYNHNTRLFVADVIAPDETSGIEFIRTTVPSALTSR